MKDIERCKILIENMPAVAWITNSDRSDYYISPSVESVLGYTAQEIYDSGIDFWFSHIHEDDLEKSISAQRELFTRKNSYSSNFRFHKKNGSWIWLRDKVVSYFTENDEEYAIGMLLDVSEHRNTENRLIESQKRFFDLAENSTDWFWEFDEQNIFTYSSPGVTRILGYTPEEMIGKSAFDFIPSPEREKVVREFAESKNVHGPFSNLENINRHKNGTLISIESSGTPIFDSQGSFRGYRGIDRDITSRKQMEALLLHAQKMDAMGRLAGGIAHDFNNILAGIMGFTDLLELSLPKDGNAAHYVLGIQKATERARHLVKQILTFGRKVESRRERVSLKSLLDETVSFIRATLPSTITIETDCDCSDDVIFADSTQLQQVLINLAANGAHAIGSRHGQIRIKFSAVTLSKSDLMHRPHLTAGEYLQMAVSDTGSGIQTELIPKIFDPYFTTNEKGNGLGLSVVDGIVSHHGGFITLDTEEGKGTTFHIYLPRHEKPQTESTEEIVEEFPGNGEHILFVDDEPLLTQVQQLSLEAMGYKVTATTSSTSALKLFEQAPNSFDLIITDQTMPELTGTELADAVTTHRPRLPIIICSGYAENTGDEMVRRENTRTYLVKPVERNTLAKVIYDYFHT